MTGLAKHTVVKLLADIGTGGAAYRDQHVKICTFVAFKRRDMMLHRRERGKR